MAVWTVKGGRQGERESRLLENGLLGGGWELLPSLEHVHDRRAACGHLRRGVPGLPGEDRVELCRATLVPAAPNADRGACRAPAQDHRHDRSWKSQRPVTSTDLISDRTSAMSVRWIGSVRMCLVTPLTRTFSTHSAPSSPSGKSAETTPKANPRGARGRRGR